METEKYSKSQLTLLVILRVLVGWHFLYEGISKLLTPGWSSFGYLSDSKGLLSGLFTSIASNPDILNIIDIINIWGLIVIGLGLILGLFSQAAKVFGIVLLSLYYLAQPPFIGYHYVTPSEGHYLFVNKNLIELFVLAVLFVFPTEKIIGVDRLLFLLKKK